MLKFRTELFETNEHLDRVNTALFKHLKIEHDNDRDILKAMQEIPANTLIEASAALVGVGWFIHRTVKFGRRSTGPRNYIWIKRWCHARAWS